MNKGGQLPMVFCLYISFAMQQKTANFKAATSSSIMQWSAFTEQGENNELAQPALRVIHTKILIREGQLPEGLRIYISVALQ